MPPEPPLGGLADGGATVGGRLIATDGVRAVKAHGSADDDDGLCSLARATYGPKGVTVVVFIVNSELLEEALAVAGVTKLTPSDTNAPAREDHVAPLFAVSSTKLEYA